MWSNLLSGTIGSVVGLVGAVLVAVVTIRRTQKADAEIARSEALVTVTRGLAVAFADTYAKLYPFTSAAGTDTPLDRTSVLASCERLRTQLLVDGPLLPPELERALKSVRKNVQNRLERTDDWPSRAEMVRLRQEVRDAGDLLAGSRRELFGKRPELSEGVRRVEPPTAEPTSRDSG